MKRLLYVLVCMLIMCACNNNGAPSLPSPDSTEEGAQPDSSTKDSDSIFGNKRDRQGESNRLGVIEVYITDLKSNISNIQSQVSSDSTQIAEMNDKIDSKMDGNAIYAFIFAFVILLFVIIVLFFKNKELNSELNEIKGKEHTHYDRLKQDLQDLQGQSSGQKGFSWSKQDIDNLNQALQSYNNRLNALEAKVRQKKVPTAQVGHENQSTVERNIYFGVNQGNKFTKELALSDENTAFKAKKISENEVEFEPLSWNKIKTFNSLEDVVTIKGSLIGSNIKVLSNGRAVKRSYNGHDFWLVTKPAEIKLV